MFYHFNLELINCKMKFQDFQGLFKYYFYGFQGLK